MPKLHLFCLIALLLTSRIAGAVSIDPYTYLYLLERIGAYGYEAVTLHLQDGWGSEQVAASQQAILDELGDDALPVGRYLTVYGPLSLYVNAAGFSKLARNSHVKEIYPGRLGTSGVEVPNDLYPTVACAGSLDVEMTLQLENLVVALDAHGDTLFSSSPALADELRREVPAFLAGLPPEGGTWLNPPTVGADGQLAYTPTLKFRVNRLGLVALIYRDKSAWIGQLGKPKDAIYVDPELLPAADAQGSVPVEISLRTPIGYSMSMPSAALAATMAARNASAAAVSATLGIEEGQSLEIIAGGIFASLTAAQLRAVLANPDPRIASIVKQVQAEPGGTTQRADFAHALRAGRAAASPVSCPPVVADPVPGARLCMRETVRAGGLEATTLLHYLHVPVADRDYPGSVFVGAIDSAAPGRLWLMDNLGVWHVHESGVAPPVFASQHFALTGINLLAAPTDLSAFSGRVSFWAGYGKSADWINSPDLHFAEMLAAGRYRKVWTAGADDDSQGEVCAVVE
jgi:hypothetical protein